MRGVEKKGGPGARCCASTGPGLASNCNIKQPRARYAIAYIMLGLRVLRCWRPTPIPLLLFLHPGSCLVAPQAGRAAEHPGAQEHPSHTPPHSSTLPYTGRF